MRTQLSALLFRARPRLQRALATLRAHRGWLEGGAITGATLLALLVVGRSAQARATALEREAAHLQEIRSGMDGWIRGAQPAAPAESLAWRESEQSLRMLSGSGPDALAVARLLTRRAEEVGIHDLRIQLAGADTVAPPPPVEAGRWVVSSGGPPLVAELAGDWSAVLALSAALPPEVELGRVQVAEVPDGLRARMVLFLRDAEERP